MRSVQSPEASRRIIISFEYVWGDRGHVLVRVRARLQPCRISHVELALATAWRLWNSAPYQRTFTFVKRVSGIACFALYVIAGSVAPGAAEKRPVIVVRGPTVVAFFESVPHAQLDKDPDTNEALADFQFYARNVRAQLRKEGIQFHKIYAHSFQLHIGNKVTTFRPVKVDVGYYLVAPGKKPRIEYGVMTTPTSCSWRMNILVLISHSKTFKTAVLSGAPQNRGTTLTHWRGVEGSREYSCRKFCIKAFPRIIQKNIRDHSRKFAAKFSFCFQTHDT
jgi:hypothetical protein